MDLRLKAILREQTVRIYDKSANVPLGTGFFLTDNLLATAAHCLYKEDNTSVNEVSLYRNNTKLSEGMCLSSNIEIAFIYVKKAMKHDSRIPVGYCANLDYGVPVNSYGYPQKQPDGYSLNNISISEKNQNDSDEDCASIKCLVRNMEGALDRYDGLSGSPVVVENCIVGMVAKEDEGGDEVNAIHMFDFNCSSIKKAFEDMEIPLKEVIYKEPKEKDLYKASVMSLYQQAWWLRSGPDGNSIISDRYSIILATLLFGITGSADIMLASSWRNALAECLQDEAGKYKKEYPCWRCRCWMEYEGGTQPEWEILKENVGVVISIHAEDCSHNLFSELLIGRRKCQKDIMVLWNIWSENPEQAIECAVRASDKLEAGAGKNLLTVFPSWKAQPDEKHPYAFLVHATARDWLRKETADHLSQDEFLLSLNPEETDAITWEVFLKYQDDPAEEWETVLKNLLEMCSASIKALVSFCGREDEMDNLLDIESYDLKRWFASVPEHECGRILSTLKRNKALYWNAVVSNPYCTRYMIQELCTQEQETFVQLLLGQELDTCSDILLQNEADTIRRQIRP